MTSSIKCYTLSLENSSLHRDWNPIVSIGDRRLPGKQICYPLHHASPHPPSFTPPPPPPSCPSPLPIFCFLCPSPPVCQMDVNHRQRLLFVGRLKSQQQASLSQGRICSDKCTCCHTEIKVAGQTFYLTQSQHTDTRPASPRADPITPGAWQG